MLYPVKLVTSASSGAIGHLLTEDVLADANSLEDLVSSNLGITSVPFFHLDTLVNLMQRQADQ